MYFTPATFIAKLLAAMQVLMTLDMPLSTTIALPVTSKPIESTVENLAWQAWIELPPEQKQQVKSRKVTPKSIFTLPLRVECPEGHKQVDTKCIPIAIGSNDVLIDLNALGLLVGNTQTEDLYDYDDVDEEMAANPSPFGSEISIGESEKSGDNIAIASKPTSKDEPLKFNIFQNKFHIFHDEPLEDYSSILNEGLQSSEKEQNLTATQSSNNSSNATVTTINRFVNEASNASVNTFEFYVQQAKNSSAGDSEAEESKTLTTLVDDENFNIDAISIPAFSFEFAKQNNLSKVKNDSSIQFLAAITDTEATTTIDDRDEPSENDLQTLLQTESFLPLLNHTTATTLQNSVVDEILTLTTVPLREPNENSSDTISFTMDEEITTLANIMEQEMEVKGKQEYTRSITISPIISKESYTGDDADDGDNDQVKDSTLEIVTNDEPLETTTPIQLDETTIIETHSSLSTAPLAQQESKEFLLQQEHAEKDLEELRRMRKGQKDQQVVVKKLKVQQPVEVLSPTTEATTKTTTPATISANLPTAVTRVNELISTTAETVTPLLTVHNENENNDRFYYRHFTKQNNEVTQHSDSELKLKAATVATASMVANDKAATNSTDIETIPAASEIDLAEELRLINEWVKGIRPSTTSTTITMMQTGTITTTTTAKPLISTMKSLPIGDDSQPSSSTNLLSESSSAAGKSTLSTAQIWSKIMPLLTTSSTTTLPKNSTVESFKATNQKEFNNTQTIEPASSARSNRNSKIIRINGFNRNTEIKLKTSEAAITTAATTTTTTKATQTTVYEDSTPSSLSATSSSSSPSSTTESNTYEPYWWLPVAWRLDKPTSSEKQPEEQEVKSEEESLLLRFWSAYAPKLS